MTPRTIRAARTAWIHRIRVQLGLAPAPSIAADGAVDPREGA